MNQCPALSSSIIKYISGFITPTWSFHWFNKWVQSISQIYQSNFTDSQWKTYSCCHQWIVTANQWPFTDSDLESGHVAHLGHGLNFFEIFVIEMELDSEKFYINSVIFIVEFYFFPFFRELIYTYIYNLDIYTRHTLYL